MLNPCLSTRNASTDLGSRAQVYRSVDGAVKVKVQWMYRPEEAASEGAAPADGWRPREILFSRHVDTIEPHQVMHPIQVRSPHASPAEYDTSGCSSSGISWLPRYRSLEWFDAGLYKVT